MSDPLQFADPATRPLSDNEQSSTLVRPVNNLAAFRLSTGFAAPATMARLRRLYIPGLSVHVFHRGHNRCPIFHQRADYKRFVALIVSAAQHNGIDVHLFALMTNHYHLVVTPSSSKALPRAMKQLHGDYVRYYNRKHNRRGTLWDGRYQAKNIDDESYWWTCLRYVERNPLEGGLVDSLEQYEWSSYRLYAMGAKNDWLVPHRLYEGLGTSAPERQCAYQAICKEL